jgi:branched-chain amino acid transport system permease protein
MTLLSFAVLGLTVGALYAALATGVITVYRATGIINFAQGAMALWAAYVCAYLRLSGRLVLPIGTVHFGHPLPLWAAVVIGVVTAILLGLLAHVGVFHWLRRAPVLAQVVASVGLMLLIQAMIIVRFGGTGNQPPNVLSQGGFTVSGAKLSNAPLLLTGIVIVMAIGVYVYFTQTKVGIATRAGAENERALVVAGYSPSRLAGVAWMVAAAVGGVAAILASPATSLDPTTYVLIIVPVLAVALIGRLDRIGVAVIAGLALGALETVLAYLTGKTWWPSWAANGVGYALPFIIIVVVLFLVGKQVPTRGTVGSMSLPIVPIPRVRPLPAVGLVATGAALLLLTSGTYRFALVNSYIFVLLGLSLVLITGYLGQISLCQMAFAGTAGLVLSKFATTLGIPFPLSPLLACLVATALGIIVGIPALRIRGAQLAVVTLAAGVACEQFVFDNSALALQGTPIRSPHPFGASLAARSPTDVSRIQFGLFVLVVVALFAFWCTKIMAGRTGRAFLAVRANERSAAGCGIGVTSTKLIGFALSSFIAGVAGCLLGYSDGFLSASSFTAIVSITLLATVYLGGITSFGGAIIAAAIAPLGLVYTFMSQTVHSGNYYAVLVGLGLILMAIFNPSGLAGQAREDLQRLRERRVRGVGGEAREGAAFREPAARTMAEPVKGATGR